MCKRALVVEDQDDLRGMLRDLLTGSDYSVIGASDGTTAIAMAKSEHPNHVLMDIQIPVMDDHEASEANKGRSGHQRNTDHRGELVCYEGG